MMMAVRRVANTSSLDTCEDISLGGGGGTLSSRGTSPQSGVAAAAKFGGPAVMPSSTASNTAAASGSVKAAQQVNGPSSLNPVASTTRVFRAVRHVHQTGDKFRFEILVEELRLRAPHEALLGVEWVRGTRRARTKELRTLSSKSGGFCGWAESDPLALIVTLFRAPGLGVLGGGSHGRPRADTTGGTGIESLTASTAPRSPSSFSLMGVRRRAATANPNDMSKAAAAASESVDLSPGCYSITPGNRQSSGASSLQRHVYAPKDTRIQILDFSAASRGKRSGGAAAGNPSVIGECRFCLSKYSTAVYPNYQRVTLPLLKCLDGNAKVTFLIGCLPVNAESVPSQLFPGQRSPAEEDENSMQRKGTLRDGGRGMSSAMLAARGMPFAKSASNLLNSEDEDEDESVSVVSVGTSHVSTNMTSGTGGAGPTVSQGDAIAAAFDAMKVSGGGNEDEELFRKFRTPSFGQVAAASALKRQSSGVSTNSRRDKAGSHHRRATAVDTLSTSASARSRSATAAAGTRGSGGGDSAVDFESRIVVSAGDQPWHSMRVSGADVGSSGGMGGTNGGSDSGSVPNIQMILVERIKQLESQVIEKDGIIAELKEEERRDQRRYEESLSTERSSAAETEARMRAELTERDEQVTRLLRQLEDMHDALDRSQKQQQLQSDQYESQLRQRDSPEKSHKSTPRGVQNGSSGATTTTPTMSPSKVSPQSSGSPVVAALRDEIKSLKRRLRDAAAQSAAYHQALDLECSKRNKILNDIERKYIQQKKSWAFEKSSLQSQMNSLNDTVLRLEAERASENRLRQTAEQQVSGLRQQMANTGDSVTLARSIETAQRELIELSNTRDELRRAGSASERKYAQQMNMLSTLASQQQEDFSLEKERFMTERRTLKNRIMELEQEMSTLPRPSVVQRLNSQLTATELQLQLASLQQQYGDDGGGGNTQGDDSSGGGTNFQGVGEGRISDPRTAIGLAQRLVELEEDLIKTKLALAESETLRDQQLDKTRKRNVLLREQLREYSRIVSDLEVQITDLKLKLRSSKGPLLGLKHFSKGKRSGGGAAQKSESFESSADCSAAAATPEAEDEGGAKATAGGAQRVNRRNLTLENYPGGGANKKSNQNTISVTNLLRRTRSGGANMADMLSAEKRTPPTDPSAAGGHNIAGEAARLGAAVAGPSSLNGSFDRESAAHTFGRPSIP